MATCCPGLSARGNFLSSGHCRSERALFLRRFSCLSVRDMFDKHGTKNLRAFVIIKIVVFYEAPAVDIDNIAFPLSSQEIKSADGLTKCCADTRGHRGFLLVEFCHETDLFAVLVSSDQT